MSEACRANHQHSPGGARPGATDPARNGGGMTAGLNVVVLDPHLTRFRSQFQAALPADATASFPDPADEQAVRDALREAQVVVTGAFTPERAALAKDLRLLHVSGAGLDQIDTTALPSGTQVCNTFHHEDSIAEYTVAAAVLLRRDFAAQDAALRQGEWLCPAFRADVPYGRALTGATVGFVGFGHIGRRAWELFRTFRARGVAVTRSGDIDAVAAGLEWAGTIADLDHLLAAADVVVLSAPLTPQTAGLIGTPQLHAMRASAVLVNVSRGGLVDPEALAEALRDNEIAGAAIDVWWNYPADGSHADPTPFPLPEGANVLMTPHSSGLTEQTFIGRIADICGNIARLGFGRPLTNVVAVTR